MFAKQTVRFGSVEWIISTKISIIKNINFSTCRLGTERMRSHIHPWNWTPSQIASKQAKHPNQTKQPTMGFICCCSTVFVVSFWQTLRWWCWSGTTGCYRMWCGGEHVFVGVSYNNNLEILIVLMRVISGFNIRLSSLLSHTASPRNRKQLVDNSLLRHPSLKSHTNH